MKLIDLDKPLSGSVVTVGTFDGVHLGHKAILSRLKLSAKQLNLPDVVLTFRVHPRLIIDPNFDIKLLTLIDEKIELLRRLGISNLHIIPFNKEMAELSGEEFIKKYLVEKLNVKHLVVGFDHKFGKGRTTGYNELIEIGKKYGFTVEKVEPITWEGEKISSTRIRKTISMGRIQEANQMLGYEYFFSGKVIEGNKLGKKLGFPTANLLINKLKQMPKYGVYLVKVEFDNFSGYGVMNYGLRPTLNQDVVPIAEVHIFDFEQDIYGKILRVRILAQIREERKFSSLSELSRQIQQDIVYARSLIKQFVEN